MRNAGDLLEDEPEMRDPRMPLFEGIEKKNFLYKYYIYKKKNALYKNFIFGRNIIGLKGKFITDNC